MAINLAQIRSELVPGLRKVTGEYKDLPAVYKEYYQEFGTSNMAQEQVTSMRFLSLAQLKNDGGNTALDDLPGERYKYNQLHIGLGTGYSVTRNTIDDNLYKKQFNTQNLGMQKSMNQAKEIYGAALFNNGTVFDPNVGGDQQPLFSSVHPVDGATIANRPFIDMDMTESAMLGAQSVIRKNYRDNANLRTFARAQKVMCSVDNQPTAIRLLESDLRPGTNMNDPNVIPLTSGGIPKGKVINDYLIAPAPWFIITDIEGLVYLQRIPFESDMYPDFLSDNLLVKCFERFSFSYYDWRSVWGTFPTS